MDSSQKYDDMLFSLLVEAKTLPNFLDVIFGFLNRRYSTNVIVIFYFSQIFFVFLVLQAYKNNTYNNNNTNYNNKVS